MFINTVGLDNDSERLVALTAASFSLLAIFYNVYVIWHDRKKMRELAQKASERAGRARTHVRHENPAFDVSANNSRGQKAWTGITLAGVSTGERESTSTDMYDEPADGYLHVVGAGTEASSGVTKMTQKELRMYLTAFYTTHAKGIKTDVELAQMAAKYYRLPTERTVKLDAAMKKKYGTGLYEFVETYAMKIKSALPSTPDTYCKGDAVEYLSVSSGNRWFKASVQQVHRNGDVTLRIEYPRKVKDVRVTTVAEKVRRSGSLV